MLYQSVHDIFENRLVLNLIASIIALSAMSGWAQDLEIPDHVQSPVPRGVFVLIKKEKPIASTLLVASKSHFRGFVLRADWATIEPAQGERNWSYFDTEITRAQAAGKGVVLGVRVGGGDDGLPAHYAGPIFDCTRQGIVVPIQWHHAAAGPFIELLRDLLSKYRLHPAVVGFRVSGIYNYRTMDWAYCHGRDDDQLITAHGYTRGKLRKHALTVVHAMVKETPKPLLLPVAGTLNEETFGVDVETTRQYIVKHVLKATRYDQLAIGRTIVDHRTPDPQEVWNSTPFNEQWRMMWDARPLNWGQRRPAHQGGPCDNGNNPRCLEQYEQMLDIALHYGMLYFEVGERAAKKRKFEAVLNCANQAMRAGGGHCGH